MYPGDIFDNIYSSKPHIDHNFTKRFVFIIILYYCIIELYHIMI